MLILNGTIMYIILCPWFTVQTVHTKLLHYFVINFLHCVELCIVRVNTLLICHFKRNNIISHHDLLPLNTHYKVD